MVSQHKHRSRNLRGIPDALWLAFAAVVGDKNRAADLRAYIEWRIENPTAKLPARRKPTDPS